MHHCGSWHKRLDCWNPYHTEFVSRLSPERSGLSTRQPLCLDGSDFGKGPSTSNFVMLRTHQYQRDRLSNEPRKYGGSSF